MEMDLLQLLHLPFWIIQLNKGIFSVHESLVSHFGQKLLGLIMDKLLGRRYTTRFIKLPIHKPITRACK